MRYIVFSDAHGSTSNMEVALENEKGNYDSIIFLGDGMNAFYDVTYLYPGVGNVCVRGNCDFSSDEPEDRTIYSDGATVYVCHGHGMYVKSSLVFLEMHAKEIGAKAALYGHTHRQEMHESNGTLILNPGAIGSNGEYAILTLENGTAKGELKRTGR